MSGRRQSHFRPSVGPLVRAEFDSIDVPGKRAGPVNRTILAPPAPGTASVGPRAGPSMLQVWSLEGAPVPTSSRRRSVEAGEVARG